MKPKQLYYCIVFLLISILPIQHKLQAQSPKFMFKSNLSHDTILIGDRVELSVYASIPSEYSVQFPIFADTLTANIEVVGTHTIDTISKSDNLQELIYKLTLTSFDSGYFQIPGFILPLVNGSTIDTVTTSPVWLTVNTLPADTTQASIYDIKPPISQPVTFWEVAPWIGGTLVLAGLVWLLVTFLRRRKKNEPLFFPRKPVEPPHIVALRELEKVREAKMWETDNHKLYHSNLTDIIRSYIEGRFMLPAMEQTTFEIVGSFKVNDLVEGKLLDELENILSLADLVKFAKMSPTLDENKSSLDFAFKFVNQTKQVEEASQFNQSDNENISDDDSKTINTKEQ